jgi:hypothetical protein
MVYLLGTDSIVEFAIVGRAGVQAVAVFHNENLLLSVGIDTMHGNIGKGIRTDLAHARNIGS